MDQILSRRWLASQRTWLIIGLLVAAGVIALFLYVCFLQLTTVSIPFASSILVRNVLTNELTVISEDGIARRVLAENSDVVRSNGLNYLRPWEVRYDLGRSHQGMRLHLTYSWVDGELLFHFSVSNLKPHMLQMLADGPGVYRYGLYFFTSTGEVLLESSVPLGDMMKSLDENGTPKSLSFYGREAISRRVYESLSDWSFNWNWGSPSDESSDSTDEVTP